MPATPGKSVSLIYVCFFDYVKNGVKLGIANKMENRAYHLSKDWGGIDLGKTFYFQCTFHKHSNEIRQLERDILGFLKTKGFKIQPQYPDGRLAYGTGVSEFISYEGLNAVAEIFNKLQKEGKGKIIQGFEPSTNLPPLKREPGIYRTERAFRERGIKLLPSYQHWNTNL